MHTECISSHLHLSPVDSLQLYNEHNYPECTTRYFISFLKLSFNAFLKSTHLCLNLIVTTIHSTSIYNDISGVSKPVCVCVCVCVCACVLSCFSHVQLFVTPRTIACQIPLSMGFSRQEYWSRLLWPPPRDLSNPGIEPSSPTMWESQVQSLGQEQPLEKEMETHSSILAWKIPWMEKPGRL